MGPCVNSDVGEVWLKYRRNCGILSGIERKLIWVNADIAAVRPTDRVAFIHRRASMNIATTSRGASGVVRGRTGQVVSIRPRANTAMAPVQTNASGAAPSPTAPAASIALPGNTRSKKSIALVLLNYYKKEI